jgi:repressor LexA
MTDSPDVHGWQVLGFLQRVAQERDNPPLSDEACRMLQTSRERLETSLEVLARLGFITSNPDTPLGYEVVPTQPPIHDLTPQQVPVVDAIANLRERLGHPPTFREIGEETGRSLTTIYDYVKRLGRVGWVHTSPGKKRTIELRKPWPPVAAGEAPQHDPSDSVPALVFIPRLGKAAAGRGVAAERLEDGGLLLPRELVGGDPGSLFALRITGDSMMGAGVFDRDQVVIRSEVWADGDMVAVLLPDEDEDEVVVKWYRRNPNGYPWLESANPKFPRIDAHGARVMGKVITLLRSYP